MNQKGLKTLGWIATCTAMLMYISYFPQIINNLHGMKSGFLQPMVAAILMGNIWLYAREEGLATDDG